MEPAHRTMMRLLRSLTAVCIIVMTAASATARTRVPTPTGSPGEQLSPTPTPEPPADGMCYESSNCFPCDVYPCRPFAASRAYCCQLVRTVISATFSFCPADAFDPADGSCTQCVYPCEVPTPGPTVCPQATPEYLSVDPVVSPTDELTQTLVVRMGNADRVQITSEAGTFVAEGAFSREDPARVTVTLLPNTANHLRVSAHVRPTSLSGCPFGDYALQTTTDLHGVPLTIVQGTERGPTIQVEPGSTTRHCAGSFDIGISNAGGADEPLEISFIGLHHAYSQGDYGTGFSWDTSHLSLPLSLAAGQAVTIPVSYNASGQDFPARLVLRIASNARNNHETQYLPYFGRLCFTPTPTPPVSLPPTPGTPTPTAAPDASCSAHVSLAPAAGPPGTVVDLQGECYRIHSGAQAQVYLDDEPLLVIGGETAGNYRALFVVPSLAEVGFHRVRIVTDREIDSGLFEVTQTAGPCFGDCNEDERVAVNELVTGVRIALGQQELDTCASLDADNNGVIAINELVFAVNRTLGGCRIPPAVASLSGSYAFAYTESDDGLPGSVRVEPASVEAGGEHVVLEFPFSGGTVRVGGTPEPDGSMALTGELVRDGLPSLPLIGYAITHKSAVGQWITGELSADTVEAAWPELIRFSLSRT